MKRRQRDQSEMKCLYSHIKLCVFAFTGVRHCKCKSAFIPYVILQRMSQSLQNLKHLLSAVSHSEDFNPLLVASATPAPYFIMRF